jgi:Protein of unknown function (DUF2946)
MHRPRSQGAGLWVSLFAVLMIFIGPLVSQAMPMNHPARVAGSDMAGHSGMSLAQDHCQVSTSPKTDSKLHGLWERCGYCSLFCHCPALPQTLCLSTHAVPAGILRLLVQVRQGHGLRPVFPGARTRAPPAIPLA